MWDEEKDEALHETYKEEALEVFRRVEATGETKVSDLFKYTYKEMPSHLKEQYEEYVQYLEGEGK